MKLIIRTILILAVGVLFLVSCGQDSMPGEEAPTPTKTVTPPTLEFQEPTPTLEPIEPESMVEAESQLPLVDDFQIEALNSGLGGFAEIGYISWSDGSGISIQTIEISNDDALALPDQTENNSVLQLDTEIAIGGWAGFSHAFANKALDTWIPQDWSHYEGISFWVFGNGTGGTLFIEVLDNRNPNSTGDDAERWTYPFSDDFEGWQYFEVPFSDFTRKDIGNGAPNDGFTLTEVHGYALGASGSVAMGQQTNYLDDVLLYGEVGERPVEISLAETSFRAKEGGLATIKLKLSRPAEETVTVQYTTIEGKAKPDIDFVLPGDTVTFEPGKISQSFKISAVDDSIAEGNEQTLIVLSNPTGASLNPQARAILTIRDNEKVDPALIFDFDEAPPFFTTEGITLTTVEVSADSGLALPDQVDSENVLAVSYNSAENPAGFSRMFPEGQDWRSDSGLSFWFYGSNSGNTITLELRNNQGITTADTVPEDWELIWSDEFDTPAGTPPDRGIWKPEIGDGMLNGILGWGNGEFEYYTDEPENAATDGEGNLVITAKEIDSDASNLRCWYGPCQYTSARLITWGSAEFAYGRVEARLKLPYGQGIWPAFWMLGIDLDEVGWPQSGETDIMENIGSEPATIHGTIHGPGYSGGEGIGAGIDLLEGNYADDFHVFAIEWQPNQIRWLMDDNEYLNLTPDDIPAGTEWVYNHPFFIILNLAIGGNWPGSPDETTVFPQMMMVDYVRVFGTANTSERFEYSFVDDFEGWQQIVIPFEAFERSSNQPAGAPDDGLDLSEIWGYSLSVTADADGMFYLDKFRRESDTP